MNYSSGIQLASWFHDRYREGTLEIRPPYQRKPVWTARQKCRLVETILLGLPIPEIFVQQTTSPEGETRYAIVDGQQRIRTVLQYIGSEADPEEQIYNKFILDKLPSTSPFRNMGFVDLADEQRVAFFEYRFVVRMLHTNDDDEVRDMFRRLNQFLTPLNAQELRNALYRGPFVGLVEQLADDEYWVENGIVKPASIRRMGDLEFVSELLIGVLHGPQSGSDAAIDEYYQQYEDYEDEFPGQKRGRALFHQTLQTIQRIFPDIRKTSRWQNKTDFYSLFVVLAALLRLHTLPSSKVPKLRRELEAFEANVDRRLEDEDAKVAKRIVEYVRAVEKGANDKPRRGTRHKILLQLLQSYFSKKGTG